MHESCVDYFFDLFGKKIHLFGTKEEVDIVAQHLKRILPVNCVKFHNAQFNGIFFRHLPNISCYFASFVDKSVNDSLSNVVPVSEAYSSKSLMLSNRSNSPESAVKQSTCDLTSNNAFNGCFDSALFSDTLKSVSDINDKFGSMFSSLATDNESSRIPPPGLIQCHKKMHNKDDFTSFMWSAPLFTKDTKNFSGLEKNLSKLNTLDGTPTIESFLESLELTKYLDLFKNHEIDFNALCTLSDSDLKEIGIYALGRKKILNAIQTFRHVDGDLQSVIFNDSNLQPRGSFLTPNVFSKESHLSYYDSIFSSYGTQNKKHYNSFLNCNDFSRSILF